MASVNVGEMLEGLLGKVNAARGAVSEAAAAARAGEGKIGTVKARMAPMAGRVISSGKKFGGNSIALKSAVFGGRPAAKAAALGMLGNSMGMGALKGAAIMGGLNAGRQMVSNGMNGQSLGNGVGTAAFRGAVYGAAGGAAYGAIAGTFRGAGGSLGKAEAKAAAAGAPMGRGWGPSAATSATAWKGMASAGAAAQDASLLAAGRANAAAAASRESLLARGAAVRQAEMAEMERKGMAQYQQRRTLKSQYGATPALLRHLQAPGF